MKGVIVRNRYYTDDGMEYVFRRLGEEFFRLDIDVRVKDAYSVIENGIGSAAIDFAVFWDKDFVQARYLERQGIRVFNSSDTVRICDDKYCTYVETYDVVAHPKTIVSPLLYEANAEEVDERFLREVARIGFPLVAKACAGSRGKQVFLLKNETELRRYYLSNKRVKHIYEAYVADSVGRDVRVYTVGGKFCAAVTRESVGFKTNAAAGAKTFPYAAPQEYIVAAERVAKRLNADYAAVDFFYGLPALLTEVNSNAYFQEAERASGINIAGEYARYISEAMSCGRK